MFNWIRSRFYTHTIIHPHPSVRIQYVSDLHLDTYGNKQPGWKIPLIEHAAKYLAICGDLGKPTHPNVNLFLRMVSSQYEKVFFVPGNHDFDSGPLYDRQKYDLYNPLIESICSQYKNVYYLNNKTHHINKNLVIVGSTLWSQPNISNCEANVDYHDHDHYHDHAIEHQKNVNWLELQLKQYGNIVVLSHFVPTFKLIEPQYLRLGLQKTRWFATNLEHLMKPPIRAWLCGHSHSVIECHINGIHCGLNAHGYGNKNKSILTRYVDIDVS